MIYAFFVFNSGSDMYMKKTTQTKFQKKPGRCLLGDVGRRGGEGRPHEAVGVVDLGVLAQQLLLALLVGEVAANLVAVLLGLQDGEEVDARPRLLAGVLAVCLGLWLAGDLVMMRRGKGENVLGFAEAED